MKEIWKVKEEFNKYEISNCGRIKSIEITYIDPEPMKMVVDRIKKEMESQLNDILDYMGAYLNKNI